MIAPASRSMPQSRRGFSAVEIIAVAAVIAMLALILIPQLRDQVERARETAVEDELGNMVKFITLSYAESSKYVRLQDYDNGKILRDTTDPDHDPAKEVPLYAYDLTTGIAAPLTAIERAALGRRWNGPYTSYQSAKKHVTIGTMKADPFWSLMLSTNAGPIVIPNNNDQDEDFYPLDPWGNPYLFFPPETDFAECLIFSMGPDGMPGRETAPAAEDYYPAERTANGKLGAVDAVLGPSDDIRWEF